MVLSALKAGITTNVAHMASDKNDRFVIKNCAKYLSRHFERFPSFDQETLRFLCWILGEEMLRIAEYLLDHAGEMQKAKFRDDLLGCDFDPDDFSRLIKDTLRNVELASPNKFRGFILNLLDKRYRDLGLRGTCEIEKNVTSLKEMFGLSDQEADLCLFLFITTSYFFAEQFFDSHLECNKFSGQKYLANMLDINKSKLKMIFYGKLKKIGLYEFSKWGLNIEDDFFDLIQNPSNKKFSQNFYFKVPEGTVPLDQYFIGKENTEHALELFKQEPKSSTHLLLYGPPGAGKTSFAHSLIQQLDAPGYEIVRTNENTAEKRRAAILACLNMTNFDQGSIVVVDEADNILNTQNSWLARGETQDKGWLNELMEKPGVRIIWITNRIDGIEESVLRRFAYSLHFKPFNRRQRVVLWENILRKNRNKRFFNEREIEELAARYDVSAGVIDLAIQKSAEKGLSSRAEFQRAVKMALEAHDTLHNYGEKRANKEKVDVNFTLEGLNVEGDPAAMIEQLKAFDNYLHQGGQNGPNNMNLLFYGPPGTGKSELARYIADQLDRKVICKRISDLQSMYVGEGEKNIKQVFMEAEAEEAVLVIDEADSLLFSRDRAVRSWEISFTNEFLTRMERFRGILICTTNRLDDLDPASLRRFNHKVCYHYLKPEGNVKFYELFLSPLTSQPLDKAKQKELENIENLAPGDFKVVRDRYAFYPKQDIDHGKLIKALQEEVALKARTLNKRKIGF